MSYSHFQTDQRLAEDASLASAAVIGTLSPGYQPVIARAAALVVTTALDNAGVVTIKHRPTAGSSSGETTVDTISYDNAAGIGAAAGDVIYVDGFEQKVAPGEELVFEVTDATPTAGEAHVVAFVQPCWEHPDNNDNMTESA